MKGVDIRYIQNVGCDTNKYSFFYSNILFTQCLLYHLPLVQSFCLGGIKMKEGDHDKVEQVEEKAQHQFIKLSQK